MQSRGQDWSKQDALQRKRKAYACTTQASGMGVTPGKAVHH